MGKHITDLTVDEFWIMIGNSVSMLPTADQLEGHDPGQVALATMLMGAPDCQRHRERNEYHVCFRCGRRADDASFLFDIRARRWIWLDLCHPCNHWVAGTACCPAYDPNWRDHR
jgi:hypothetical protein